ncbi:50S ribosomal protein L29 [Metamycoplasma buccale]|uniref:50S ribosomal protein L29 n=1 Tax=Metamycoplasma buccale TaxID=55602 RepID=UPI00398F0D65
MQYSELKEKSLKELQDLLLEYKAELFSLRFKNATRQLDQVHKIDLIKKDIARTLTAINVKKLEQKSPKMSNNKKEETNKGDK